MSQVIPEIHRDITHPIEQFFEGVFDRLRAQLRDRYADWTPGQGSDKRRAIQTMVHNESVFFPIWLSYYSRFFAPEDIFVFDHQTTDGSTARDGFVRIPVEHESVDHVWMVETMASHQRELLDRYDVVLTTDVDELVVPDPAWGSLGDYIDRFDEDSSTASAMSCCTSPIVSRPCDSASRSSHSAATGSPMTPTTSRRWRLRRPRGHPAFTARPAACPWIRTCS